MMGHTEDNCIKKLKATIEKLGHSKDGKANSSSIAANMAAMSNVPSNKYNDAICLFVTKQGNETEANEWVVDSGATEHMCSHQEWFISYHPLPVRREVHLGNGAIIYALTIGHVTLDFNLDSTTRRGVIKDVYYVPNLVGNLFSLPYLTKRRYKTVFEDNACRLYHPSGSLTAVAQLHYGLFFLNAKPYTATVYVATVPNDAERPTLPNIPTSAYAAKSKSTTVSLDIWHR